MVKLKEFIAAFEATQKNRSLNANQRQCVETAPTVPLMIVAGPGCGKTAVLVLRALRHILVDAIAPDEVLITTFTKKAAKEIRSRLISWGLPLVEELRRRAVAQGDTKQDAWLARLDLNLCKSGTLDSFCQEWLGAIRNPGEPQPIVLEEFASKILFARRVFGTAYHANKGLLDGYIGAFSPDGEPPHSQGDAVDDIKAIHDRLVQDLVNVGAYRKSKPDEHAKEAVAAHLEAFNAYLTGTSQFNFALAATHCLAHLQNGTLYPKIDPVTALLIDEYHDTNPLQEAIYFEIAKQGKGAVTVVADDDQSLYRFRGATVELFTNFQQRFFTITGLPKPKIEYLFLNYRSTPEIVTFFNDFIACDPAFTGARVQPPKPPISPNRSSAKIPVLGLFRDTKENLASAIADVLQGVFSAKGLALPNGQVLRGAPKDGGYGDAVFLAHSVQEWKSFWGKANPGFPSFLRTELDNRGIGIFNPRGQALRDIDAVQRLLGLVAECLDFTGTIGDIAISMDARGRIATWRTLAQQFILTNPPPNKTPDGKKRGLAEFVNAWRAGKPGPGFKTWPGEWPLLDLVYTLLAWFPMFQNDPEHQIYLEAITRCLTQAANVSAYGMSLYNDEPHKTRSRQAVWRDVLAPIADRVIDVDEDMLLTVPRDRLNVMTIHQAKGLEFPLVFVDVGSEFTGNYEKQRFKRFPDKHSSVTALESHLAPYTTIGALRVARPDLDRTFDDLVREYYVAYSRAQSALVLCGLDRLLKYNTNIKNVATFWRRDESWAWRQSIPAGVKPPATVNAHPLMEI